MGEASPLCARVPEATLFNFPRTGLSVTGRDGGADPGHPGGTSLSPRKSQAPAPHQPGKMHPQTPAGAYLCFLSSVQSLSGV